MSFFWHSPRLSLPEQTGGFFHACLSYHTFLKNARVFANFFSSRMIFSIFASGNAAGCKKRAICLRFRFQPRAAGTKSFLLQQFFKNAGEAWASSPHLRSKSNCIMKENKNLRENRKESQLPSKSKGCNEITRFQGQLRFPRQAGDVPQPCRIGFGWFS